MGIANIKFILKSHFSIISILRQLVQMQVKINI